MRSFLPPFSAALAACAPAPQDAASSATAARAPIPETVSVAEQLHPATTDSAAAARGRRTLSTAFVRLGPGGHLLVTLRDGRVLQLRDVTMGKTDFCGVAGDGMPGKRRCASYADVATARAVDAAPGDTPVPAGSGASANQRGLGGR